MDHVLRLQGQLIMAPKSWIKSHKNERWLYFLAPVSDKTERSLREEFPNADRVGFSGKLYTLFKGKWWRERKLPNPDYVEPPLIVNLYGLPNAGVGGCVLCWFPPNTPWRKVVLPALKPIARVWGTTLRQAYCEGIDEETWERCKEVKHYKWDGSKLVLLS